jgi:hypothetical protein
MNLYVYIVNVLVSVGVIIFCAFKIMTDGRPEVTSVYLPIMSGILGWYVPNPSIKKKEDRNLINSNNSSIGQYTNSSQQSGSNPPPSPPLSPTAISVDIPNRINNI